MQANETDPNDGNNTDSEETDVVRQTDLAMDKRDDGSDAVAGTNYTYTLEVTNHGPSDSSGATVTDTLPAHWQFVASSNASCSGNGSDPETVTCTVGPLVSGAATSFTITAAVPSSAVPGTVTNTAHVQANETDPNGSNNTDSETTDVVPPLPDLAMDKRDDGSDAVAGTNYTYTLEVTNRGSRDSSGATVTDTLPADWHFVSSSNASCSGNGSDPETVTCTVGPLVSGAATSFTITVAVPSSAVAGTVTNTAHVQANEPDPNSGNDTDSETTDVVRRTDLAIDKRDDGSDAVAGTNYTYTLEVTNLGPSDSSGATVTDTLPAALAVRRFIERQLRRQRSGSGNGDLHGRPARVGRRDQLHDHRGRAVQRRPGHRDQTAQVQANETDPNSGNDTDSETTDVVRRTDLAIDKRDDGSDAVAGTNYTYTLEVTNLGPSDSSGATVTDTLPAHWQFVASSNASCSGNGADPETVTCTVGPLVSGAATSFTITVAVPSNAVPGTVTNTAHVQANEPDPNSGNDTDSETTDVVRQDGSGDRQAGRRLGRRGGDELHVHAGSDERRPVGFQRARRSRIHCRQTGVRRFIQRRLAAATERSGNGDLHGRPARVGRRGQLHDHRGRAFQRRPGHRDQYGAVCRRTRRTPTAAMTRTAKRRTWWPAPTCGWTKRTRRIR